MLDLSRFEQGDIEESIAVVCLVAINRATREYLEKSDGRNPCDVLEVIKSVIEQYESLFIEEGKAD